MQAEELAEASAAPLPAAAAAAARRRPMERLRRLLLRETYALPVDVFRILAGLLCFAYFVSLSTEVPDFSAPDGLLDHQLLQRVFWYTRVSLFQPPLSASFFYAAFAFGCVGSLAIAAGHRVRFWATALFLIAVSTYRWNFIVMYVDDSIMHLLLLWLILLPAGRTLVLSEWLRQRGAAWRRWTQVTVPGAAVWGLMLNMCLVYLTAGLWKLESPMWHSGFALYATLRLPISRAPDFWTPSQLPGLRLATWAALVIEPLIPVLLLLRKNHPLKWLGLLAQQGFHLGIIATLRIPFANLAMMASAVLFFREEIMDWVLRHGSRPRLQRATVIDRAGRCALALVLALTLAMMRRLPVIGQVHQPAYAALWFAGLAQDYQLFNWIDRKNFSVAYEVWEVAFPGKVERLPPMAVFPDSLRAVLLQSYLHDVRWIKVPTEYRDILKQSILHRIAERACRLHHFEGNVLAWSLVQRITPDNVALRRAARHFLLEFRCRNGEAVVCQTMLTKTRSAACRF